MAVIKVSDSNRVIELAILGAVNNLNALQARTLTFGQIYMELVRTQTDFPTIKECVAIVNVLVAEGLIVSKGILEHDPGFPYTQHLIGGVTEVGVAALMTYDALLE
ncbi:hypothetical protein [Pseudomonas syringae]|uniref:hypothetical protein n=1 Tax=Pseudomonas syringae TaxID=317 RepID=UPI000EFFFEEF|nr:hypothetical protein [Pseudomonas syringae]